MNELGYYKSLNTESKKIKAYKPLTQPVKQLSQYEAESSEKVQEATHTNLKKIGNLDSKRKLKIEELNKAENQLKEFHTKRDKQIKEFSKYLLTETAKINGAREAMVLAEASLTKREGDISEAEQNIAKRQSDLVFEGNKLKFLKQETEKLINGKNQEIDTLSESISSLTLQKADITAKLQKEKSDLDRDIESKSTDYSKLDKLALGKYNELEGFKKEIKQRDRDILIKEKKINVEIAVLAEKAEKLDTRDKYLNDRIGMLNRATREMESKGVKIDG